MKTLFALGGAFKIQVFLWLSWFTPVICIILTMNVKLKDIPQARIGLLLSKYLSDLHHATIDVDTRGINDEKDKRYGYCVIGKGKTESSR